MNTSTCLLLAAGLLVASEAQARNPNPGIVSPDHSFHGMTYPQWSSELLQWRLGIPADISPDDVPQFGAVWFLVSSFGATLARTPVTVPSDKFLFVPIISSTWVPLGYGSEELTVMRRRFATDADVESMISEWTIWCEIDGVAVADLASYRTITAPGEAYFVRLPDDNLFGVPAGRYGPTVNGGIYLMLRPLSAGEHTIQIFVSDDATFTSDVTYELTVE
jgi:hypothetical protein